MSGRFGGPVKLVARRGRVAANQGNIVGQDIGATGGFGVLSFNGGSQHKVLQLSAGIDNLLDKTYAEAHQPVGVAVPGYAQTTKATTSWGAICG